MKYKIDTAYVYKRMEYIHRKIEYLSFYPNTPKRKVSIFTSIPIPQYAL